MPHFKKNEIIEQEQIDISRLCNILQQNYLTSTDLKGEIKVRSVLISQVPLAPPLMKRVRAGRVTSRTGRALRLRRRRGPTGDRLGCTRLRAVLGADRAAVALGTGHIVPRS